MSKQFQNGLILLQKQLQRYLKTPMSSRIIPLIGFCLYLTLMPRFLFKIIPFELTQNSYFSQQTSKTILYMVFLIFGNFFTVACYSIFMYFVYTKKINLQNYRVDPVHLILNQEQNWPWQENHEEWNILLKRTIKAILINTILVGVLTLTIWALVLPRKIIVSSQLPPYQTIFWQFILFMIIQDCTSTFTHTLLHSPQLYWIHKKHHQYTTTVSIAAEYAHPIEFIFSNSLPTIIGFKFLAYFCPVHIITAITWLIYRILLTSDLHSGYEFPWDAYKILPFTAPASYHDFHHSHNVGNYASSFMIIEALIGHNKQYYKFLSNKQRSKTKKQDKNE